VKGSITAESLERTIRGAIDKVHMRHQIAHQHELLKIADGHRAMIASLGSTCRTVSEPLAVVTSCLEILQRQATFPQMARTIRKCAEATESINAFFGKLELVCRYREESYLG